MRIRILWASGRPLEWRYVASNKWYPVDWSQHIFETALKCSVSWEFRFADRTK